MRPRIESRFQPGLGKSDPTTLLENDVILWLSNAPTPQFAGIIAALQKDLELDVVHLDSGDRGRGWGDFSKEYTFALVGPTWLDALRVAWVKMRRSPEALVCFGYASPIAILLLILARVRRIPVYAMSDSSWYIEKTRPRWRRSLKRAALWGLFPRRARIWVIGTENAEYWRRYGFTNQVLTRFESPVPSSTALPPGSHGKVVLYVGRLAPEKGVDDAVKAFHLVAGETDEVHLWIVGQGEDLAKRVDDPRIHLVGAVPHSQLAPYFEAADVLVVPSRYEPYGLVVREALQFGLPVVGTEAVPALRELCDLGWNVVAPGDPDALARAIERSLDEVRWPEMPVKDTAPFYKDELSRPRAEEVARRI